MPSWNDAFDETTDWTAVGFADMFQKAVWERSVALIGDGTEPGNVYATDTFQYFGGPVAAGDYVAKADFWASLQAAVEGFIGTDTESLDPYAKIGQWVPEDYDPDGRQYINDDGFHHDFSSPEEAALSWGQIREDLEYPTDLSSWRRKKPREVNLIDPAPDEDQDGNTLADGMIAWDVNTFSGPDFRSRLVKRTAGVWAEVSSAAESPDVLDSYASAPDACLPSTVQVGDYIGPWLFNELRDMINALTRIYVLAEVGTRNTVYYITRQNVDTDEYEYIDAATVGLDPGPFEAVSFWQFDHAEWYRASGDVSAGIIQRGLKRTIDYYNATGPTTAVDIATFDANGDPVHENAVTKWLTKSYDVGEPATGDVYTTGEPFGGPASTKPHSASGGPDQRNTRGWSGVFLFNLITYDFEFKGPG